MDLRGKKIAIIGVGIEGISTAKYLKNKNTKISVLEKKKESELDEQILKKAKSLNVNLVFGDRYLDFLDYNDVVFRSPSVRPDLPELKRFRKKGGVVTSQTQTFFELCRAPIIGVTGTKGKGTTSSLLSQILIGAGRKAVLAGNIGNPPLDYLDRVTDDSLVILELSSFQLFDLQKSPHVAVVLMVSSEHLDWHKSVEEYIEAKKNIVKNQNTKDMVVINADYPVSRNIGDQSKGEKYYFSIKEKPSKGSYVEDGKIVLVDGERRHEVDISRAKLPGRHNLQNICAATLTASILKVPTDLIEKGVSEFVGLPHRLEFVKEVDGVSYYDDSASTIPETSIAAIKSFREPKIIILGGSSKNSDFTSIGRGIVENNISATILIGEEAPRIKDAIEKAGNYTGKLVEGLSNMKYVVEKASQLAKAGDVVILSPGCASFDMFKNYSERGEQFKKYVREI